MTLKIILFFGWLIIGVVNLCLPKLGKLSYALVWIVLISHLLSDIVRMAYELG